jgi:hypothetical protein
MKSPFRSPVVVDQFLSRFHETFPMRLRPKTTDTRSHRGRVCVAALALGLFASGALAQFGSGQRGMQQPSDEPMRFPQVAMPPIESQSSQPGTILTYAVGVLLAVGAVAVAAMPSRREHRD